MATFSAHKVVSALPASLSSSTLYFVRNGAGFDLYLTNESGIVIAYPINNNSASGNIDGSTPSSTATSNIDGGTP